MSILGTVIVGVVILVGVIGAVVQIWPSAPVVGGVVGWCIGLPLGLVLGMIAAIFLVEYLRSSDTARAWKATVQALKAFGWTIAIELIAALTCATAWGIGVALAAAGN